MSPDPVFACQLNHPATTLADLRPGQSARVHAVGVNHTLGQRLMALGLLPGQQVTFLKNAPFGDPILVEVGSRLLALRRREAREVVVGNL